MPAPSQTYTQAEEFNLVPIVVNGVTINASRVLNTIGHKWIVTVSVSGRPNFLIFSVANAQVPDTLPVAAEMLIRSLVDVAYDIALGLPPV